MPWDYSDKTKELFTAAVQGEQGTHLGEILEPDGVGNHGSIACGDALSFTFRVDRDEDPLKDVIVEARYLTFGCTSAIASSEALCRIIESKRCTPIEALRITNRDIVEFVGGLPEQKIHCSVMGAEALQAAVLDWAKKRGVNLAELGIDIRTQMQEEGRIVCNCFALTEPYIKRKIRELNLRTIPEIIGATKAGGACTMCQSKQGGLQDILDEVWGKTQTNNPNNLLPILDNISSATAANLTASELPTSTTPNQSANSLNSSPNSSTNASTNSPEQLSPFKFYRQVEGVIDGSIRPMLRRDGGDLELVDIKELVVYVELKGSCSGCAGATQTIKSVVERMLRDGVDRRIRVIQV
ncbi:MAG: iron-sulfur cluster assembly scaffold protein [Planctomycetaceae bacterium]|jgi:NifU-like protein|nr:iron-sulfur cluster assembly scaffold protein [Planctomycetaceae bacterium]